MDPIEDLLADVRRRRRFFDLQRTGVVHAPQTKTMARLRELERACQGAEARLRRAQQEGPPHSRG